MGHGYCLLCYACSDSMLMKFSQGLDIVNILSSNISKRDSLTNIISISSILSIYLSFFMRWMLLNFWALI